jgi:parallel beta-helix repeat protein
MNFSISTFFGAPAALLLCATLAAQPATEVKCGMMVTSNLTLTADLNCPSLTDAGAALMVVANGVKVDLSGHSITGGGKGFGVLVPGADNVTILNGEIRGFMLGVMVTQGQKGDRAYSPRLTGLRLTGNFMGVDLDGARFGEISDCEVSQNSFAGIVVFNGTDYTAVSRNLVYANARHGIVVGCNPSVLDPKGSSVAACDGLHSTENTVEGNTILANGWAKGTVADANSGIIILFGDRNVVRRNLVLDNNTTGDGGQLNVTTGIMVSGGADNVVADNSVTANGVGVGVTMAPGVPTTYATNTVVSGNSVVHSASSGIIVYGEAATGTVISDNNAIANGHAEKTGFPFQCRSGIRVQGSGASLMNNRAYDNVGYGFNVETKDVKAQFGNRAKRNGAPSQCSGLPCQ